MTTPWEQSQQEAEEQRHPGLGAIMSERRQLLNLAYRLLGSLADAEDVVQEAYTRWYAMSRARQEAVESPGAWLTTLDESVSMAFLVVFESLTPAERVAFVLHDVFRYPFAEVAEILGRSPAACRQLASSARRRIAARAEASPDATRQASVVRRFKTAWEAQDIEALLGLLDPGATAISDGGGRAIAHPLPIEGAERIAQLYLTIARLAPARTILERTVNGLPGLVIESEGRIETVFAFDVAEDDRITRIWAVRNPDKLQPWQVS